MPCYWGHTSDPSKMKVCTDGSNPVCPVCCHGHCINQFNEMYRACQARGFPVWQPQNAGHYSPPAQKCYWGHTSEGSRMKLCTDGKNPVCPGCCHFNCPTDYPGLYQECSRRGWPVWPPGNFGPAAASEVRCYWKHTIDRTKMKTCADGTSLVCPDCCTHSCPGDSPDWNTKCRGAGFPVWGSPARNVPAVIPMADWQFDIDILQDGAPVNGRDGTFCIKRKMFTIRLRLPRPVNVRLNTLDSDRNFQKIQPGAVIEYDRAFVPRPAGDDINCFRTGTGDVDGDFFKTRLIVAYGSHQEIVFKKYLDHGWSRVDVNEERAILERDVSFIHLKAQGYDMPLERYKEGRLYLMFLVKHHEDGQIHGDELRKLVLEFTG